MHTQFFVNDIPLAYDVDGEIASGDDAVALAADDDLIRKAEWAQQGYGVFPFLTPPLRKQLLDGATDIVRRKVEEVTGKAAAGFSLERYHRFVATDEQHYACVRSHALCRAAEECPIDLALVEGWASEHLRIPVAAYHSAVNKRMFCIRLVRAGKPDYNPPHRDNYIERLRNGVNAYIPLAGSNEQSSLPLVPGSHRWKESQIKRTQGSAIVNGVPFSVPAIISGPDGGPVRMIRPNPKPDEGMIFSPYIVHGGGVNLQVDATRASLEMRFFKA